VTDSNNYYNQGAWPSEVLTALTPSNVHNNSNDSHDPNRAFIIVLTRVIVKIVLDRGDPLASIMLLLLLLSSTVTLHCIDFLVP